MEGLPAPPEEHYNLDGKRLWIGNLDDKITEFALLKLLQKYGELEQFDFLYHRVGPDQGKPRGYCFATYKTAQEAQKAQKSLHGKLALKKRLIVKPAQGEKNVSLSSKKPESTLRIAGSRSTSQNTAKSCCVSSKIAALEAQLKSLEKKKETDINAFLPGTSKAENSSSLSKVRDRNGHQCKGNNQRNGMLEHTAPKYNNQRQSQMTHSDKKKPYSKHKP